MKYLVFGAGGTGGSLAAFLAQGGKGRLPDRPGGPSGGHPEKRSGVGEPAWDLCRSGGGGGRGALLLPS